MPTADKFIRRGYFPKEVPPSFKTSSLAKALDSTRPHFPFQDATRQISWTQPMHHSLARAGVVRRVLSIPNPVGHWALAKEIAEHWTLIRSHIRQSTLSLSTPTLRGTQGRAAAPRTALADVMFARVSTRATGRYLLRADVSEFYRSVYTHSIPWALHTKAVAKAQQRNSTLLGNRLDAAVRATQYGQTNGIPIGPDTSLILAEVVLSSVDQELATRVGPLKGHRHHDDYELVFDSAREAEEGRAALQEILLEAGLHLNPLKTTLTGLPTEIVPEWWSYVRHFGFSAGTDARARVIEFFNEAFARKAARPSEYILAYALGRLEHEHWTAKSWTVLQPLLHQALAAEPSAAHKFVRLLVHAELNGLAVDRALLSSTIERMLLDHAPLGHASEVAWMLWAALVFELRLSDKSGKAASQMRDSFVALLALDARARGLAPTLDPSRWAEMLTADSLDGDMWLLSYEARVRGWLPTYGGGNHVSEHQHFGFLAALRVRFYSRMRTLSWRTLRRLAETDAAAYGGAVSWPSWMDSEDDEEDEVIPPASTTQF